MAAETFVKVGNDWNKMGNAGVYANVGGTWQPIEYIYNNVAGTWQTTYVRDNTGPASPSNVTATWEGSGLRINWTNPPDADYSYMQILPWPAGQPSLSPFTVSAPGQTAHYSAYILDYTVYTVYLTPFDTHGNAGPTIAVQSMAWTGAARGRAPSPFWITPIDSGTWRNGAWRTDDFLAWGTRLVQGAGPSGINTGAFFYGSTAWTYLRGATVSQASVSLIRINQSGLAGVVEPEAYWSNNITSKASNVDAGSLNNYYASPTGMSRDGVGSIGMYMEVPASWRAAIGASSLGSSLRSVLLRSNDSTLQPSIGNVSYSYMIMRGGLDTGVPPWTQGNIGVNHSG